MRIHLMSDSSQGYHKHEAPENTDIVVLAGDIGMGDKGIKWAADMFKGLPIIYVPGNHEYYRHDIEDNLIIKNTADKLGIHYLENESIILEGIRFLGCTLWTDFNKIDDLKSAEVITLLNDYHYISSKKWWESKNNNKKDALKFIGETKLSKYTFNEFSPAVAYQKHCDSVRWLDQCLCDDYQGRTVIVSHHAPSYKSLTQSITDEPGFDLEDYHYVAYASDLDDLIIKHNDKINFWLHGHVHQSSNYSIGDVNIISNPKEQDKNSGYDSKLLIYV